MSESNNFFSLSKFDRVLFSGVILSHIIIIWDPIKHAITSEFSRETGLVIYVILITLFWTIYFAIFAANQVRGISGENRRLNEENAILAKNKGYIDAYWHIGLGFSLIHQMQRNINQIDPNSDTHEDQLALIIMQFEEMCLHFSDGFKLITGKNDISVCLKLINGKEITKDTLVKTFVRDSKNVGRNYEESGSMHLIDGNTSFSSIVKKMSKGQDGRCFICNNLPQLQGYKNTSFSVYNQEELPDNLNADERNQKWKMPYKSSIVTGIYPNQKQYYKDKYLIGFLCIDSNAIDAFHDKDDQLVLTGIADGIYNTLKAFNQLTQKTKT